MSLPVIVLPVGTDDVALDACLAALDAGTPAGTPVWLADDAQAGPRGQAVIQRWLTATPLQAEYSRRAQPVGAVAHLDQVLAACGAADVLVLAPDAVPTPGWANRLAACGRQDAAIATATPWCNAGQTASWPRLGEVFPLPADLDALAQAAARLAPTLPELPAAVDHAVWINGRARQRAGGLDMATFDSWYAALIDLSLRLAGLGWRNVLCETAFVGRSGEGGPAEGELERLATRWPAWQARIATFLMHDPLHPLRANLTAALAASNSDTPQRALFD